MKVANSKLHQDEDEKNQELDSPNRMHCTALYIQQRVYLLSAFVGNRDDKRKKRRGTFGLVLWIFSLVLHFAIDFYEAIYVFHTSWLSCQVLFFVFFLISSVYVNKHVVMWVVEFTRVLRDEVVYYETLKKMHVISRYIPTINIILPLSAAIGQYLCYYHDDALTLHLVFYHPNHTPTNSNNTNEGWKLNITQSDLQKRGFRTTGVYTGHHLIPVEHLLNVIRFISLFHIYYMAFLILVLGFLICFGITDSQHEFNTYLGEELSKRRNQITLIDAINKFEFRVRVLRSASEHTSIILTTVVLVMSASFVVNVYNFLYMKRFAIYVWFAIAPLIWIICPMIGAAVMTSSYQDLKSVIIESWMKVPDEVERRLSQSGTESLLHVRSFIESRLDSTEETKSQSNSSLSSYSDSEDNDGEKESHIDKIPTEPRRDKTEFLGEMFDFEKYIKCLEHYLEYTGFSIVNVIITWDRVSFYLVLLSTLVGAFAQNVIIKSLKQNFSK